MNNFVEKLLSGQRVALIFSHGNLTVNHNAGLIRGVGNGLLELGAAVNIFSTAYFIDEIKSRYRKTKYAEEVVFAEESELVSSIINFLEEFDVKYDLIIGYFYDSQLTQKTKKTLRKYGKKLINYPLNLQDQPFLFKEALNFFDETWCAEEFVIESLAGQYGNKIRYVPMASDPSLYRPLVAPKLPNLFFVGSAYGSRLSLLALASKAVPVVAGGVGFEKISIIKQGLKHILRGSYLKGLRLLLDWLVFQRVNLLNDVLSDEGFVKKASECGISLGFNDVFLPNGAIGYKVRLREYESTMCGLCHIAQRLPELSRHFVDRKEILLYDSEAEFLELLHLIATGEIDWQAIGQAARLRSISEHTWASRLACALGTD